MKGTSMDMGSIRVGDKMITDVITTSPNTTARDAWRIMEKSHIRHLPVVVGEKLVGMLSQRELYLYLTTFAVYSEPRESEPGKKPEDVVKIRIEEIMSRDPYVIFPQNTIEEAARRMAHHKLSALPVVEDEKRRLVGIITTQDILSHISDEFQPGSLLD